jgi:elongation factor 1-alpha
LQDVGQGTVVSEMGDTPSSTAESFIGQVIQLNTPQETVAGGEIWIDICTACVRCKAAEVLQKIDRRSGKILEDSSKSLKAGEVGFCKIEPQERVCVECVADFPLLGRFCIRHEDKVVAVGMVKSVVRAPIQPVYP